MVESLGDGIVVFVLSKPVDSSSCVSSDLWLDLADDMMAETQRRIP